MNVLPVIDLAYEKFRDRAEAVARLMQYARVVLSLDAPAMNESRAIKESGVITVDRPTGPPLVDRQPWPEDDAPNIGTPLNEARHIEIEERPDLDPIPVEEWLKMSPEQREAERLRR